MRQVLVVKSEVLDISANSGGSHPLYGCFSPPNMPHTQFPVATGTNLKQQFRNGVSEPAVGLVQFSHDIFLIVLDNMATGHGHIANTPSFPLINGVDLLVWVKALEASTITLRYKENCSAPTRSMDSSSSISSQSKIETRPFWVDHKLDFL